MARRVDQVEAAEPALAVVVPQGHRVALDRDPPLTFDVHRVQDLVPEVAILHRAAVLDQPVGKRRLAVIDVSDDAEVTDRHARSTSYCARPKSGRRAQFHPCAR